MTDQSRGSASAQSVGSADLPVPPGFELQALPRPEPAPAGENMEQPRSDSGSETATSERATFARHVHEYIREYIRLADQKAMFFFASSTALLAFLFRSGVSARWLKDIMTWNPLDLTAFVAMFALAVSALAALLVVIPRTPGSRRGHVFWEAIAEFASARDYADEIARMTGATFAQLQAEHCFELAKVCRRKYGTLRVALWIGAAGLLATVVVLLFVPAPGPRA